MRRLPPAHALGWRAEDLAHRHLQSQGLIVTARNYRLRGTSHEELDLVARDGETIVFVEVKSRSSEAFGTPDQAVDQEKRQHLIRVASVYLRAAGKTWKDARFDIITVVFDGKPRIQHIRDAFARPSRV
jgi:putative endonuclease